MGLGAKFQVLFAFAFRLPLIALSALHLSYVASLRTSDQPLLTVASPVAVKQAMLTWSLVSVTIPNMKRFMKSFDMDFGVVVSRGDKDIFTADDGFTCDAGRAGRGSENVYPLQNIHNKRDSLYLALQPETAQYKASAEAHDGGSSLRESDSQEMIIRKDVQWEVCTQ